MSQQEIPATAARHYSMSNSKRVQRLLDEIGAKQDSLPRGILRMEDTAQAMFLDYTNELTLSVLEAASMMAKHRKSDNIDVDDIKIILAKKLGVELPGFSSFEGVEEEDDADEVEVTPATATESTTNNSSSSSGSSSQDNVRKGPTEVSAADKDLPATTTGNPNEESTAAAAAETAVAVQGNNTKKRKLEEVQSTDGGSSNSPTPIPPTGN
mmetsp:Transcript_25212/g.42008  ORF Transcript_25212/g.42008 Transcript_25212/m.42008 type:complete len:211 (-) Transcript_25212:395-1027(-)|eukprot:CAMPEP_0175021606 /NCGR_PEP_ID=MMETSP0005-20121125/14808_1 /TAXON_ID=420556 /ORGANISM="Ochromonas sp., Strain CCMP1393" /LENGTH=210 /DNA_ID=CAMNT_0016279673 /DNA_START=12 /DNA_END=644 /DNA_ORIENTATION=-